MNRKLCKTLLSISLFAVSILFSLPSHAEYIGTGPYADNCVLYLKNVRGVKFPPGDLSYWPAKLRIKNQPKPKKGRVAIIEILSGDFKPNGHVALVTDVDDKGKKMSITIEEAHYPKTGYWRRKVEGSKLSDIEKS